jgi:hypothetical protein
VDPRSLPQAATKHRPTALQILQVQARALSRALRRVVKEATLPQNPVTAPRRRSVVASGRSAAVARPTRATARKDRHRVVAQRLMPRCPMRATLMEAIRTTMAMMMRLTHQKRTVAPRAISRLGAAMAHRASASVVDVVAVVAIVAMAETQPAVQVMARRRRHPDARFSHVAAAHFAKVEQETSITGHV